MVATQSTLIAHCGASKVDREFLKTLPLPDSWVDPTVGVKTSVTVAVPPLNKVPIEHRTFEFAGEVQLPGELEIDVNVAPDVGRSA